jgi:chemotaxis protein methyltransferase CheR
MVKESNELLYLVRDRIASEVGIYFPVHRIDMLEKRLLSAASEIGIEQANLADTLETILHLNWEPEVVSKIVGHLTVAETYFYREQALWEHFENEVVPKLRSKLRDGREVKIWSTSCCTGEEPYTVAMILKDRLASEELSRLSIYGADINRSYLEQAEAGIYSDYSLRTTPELIKQRYFSRVAGGRFEIAKEIKGMVNFGFHNLVKQTDSVLEGNSPSGDVDVILCRNTLIYFHDEQIARTVAALSRRMKADGWCYLGPAETWKAPPELFQFEHFPGLMVLRTRDHGATRGRTGQNKTPRVLHSARSRPKPVIQVVPEPEQPNSIENLAQDCVPVYVSPESAVRQSAEGELDRLKRLAEYSLQMGETEKATALIEQALELDRLDAHLYYVLAMIYVEENNNLKAAHALRQAIFLEPSMVLAQYMLGRICQREEKDLQAEVHLANARNLLAKLAPDVLLENAGGLTAGRLLEILQSTPTFRRQGLAKSNDQPRAESTPK